MKIFITGVSGCGKTTIAAKMHEQGYNAFDIEQIANLCNWQNKTTKEIVSRTVQRTPEFLSEHDWVCNTLQLEQILAEAENETVIAAGVVSNQKEFLHLFDHVILLQCNHVILAERLRTRTGNNFGKSDFERDRVLSYKDDFESNMISLGAKPLINDGNIDSSIKKIISILVAD